MKVNDPGEEDSKSGHLTKKTVLADFAQWNYFSLVSDTAVCKPSILSRLHSPHPLGSKSHCLPHSPQTPAPIVYWFSLSP